MVLAFLSGERDKFALCSSGRASIESPDLGDRNQNQFRRRLLRSRRGPLLDEVPESTRWHEVRFLMGDHLGELLVIGSGDWVGRREAHQLLGVASRRPVGLRQAPGEWAAPVLWGHDRAGPFTILEGNHRLVAYAGATAPPRLEIPVVVGLSSETCYWHRPDA